MHRLLLVALCLVTACGGSSRTGGGPPPPGPGGPPGTGGPPPVASGVTYWVDAARGSDDADGRSPASAFQTLHRGVRALDAAGGDELWLSGTFRETLTLSGINGGGSVPPDPSRPTIIRCAEDGAGRPVPAVIDGGVVGAAAFPFDQRGLPPGFGPGQGNYLDRGISIAQCNYITVSGIRVRGIAGDAVYAWRSSHLRFEGLTTEWNALSAIKVVNGKRVDPPVFDITVAHCDVRQSNLGLWANKALGQGFSMQTETVSLAEVHGFSVYGNRLRNSLMAGIDFKFSSRDGLIYDNDLENMRAAAIYANEGDATRIFHNVVRHVGYYDPEDGSGLQNANQYLGQRGGTAAGSEDGAVGILIANGDLPPFVEYESGRSSGIEVFENTVSWTRRGGIVVWNQWLRQGRSGWQLDDLHIYNNVVHGACQAPNSATFGIFVDDGVSNSLVANNIVTACPSPAIGVGTAVSPILASTVRVTHNLLWGNVAGGAPGASAVFADPRFVRRPGAVGAAEDFRLLPASPAVGAGTSVPLASVVGGVVDIGAFQVNAPPWRPSP